MSKFYFFVNGINANIGNLWGWQYKARRWVEMYTDADADCYTYHVNALDRWVHQAGHVAKAMDLLTGWSGKYSYRVGVGHSNGCEILRQMLVKNPSLKLDELHLIAPAVGHDFATNGLNEVLGRLQRLVIYCSPDDRALKFARRTSWVRWLNSRWGYGYLGLVGPKNVDPSVEHKVKVIPFPGYDHSSYFNDANFDSTMHRVVNGGRQGAED